MWFFDRGKPAERKDQVLMIDARSLYRVISRKIRDFSEEQLKNLTAIAWLYRGEQDRYLKLVHEYFMQTYQEYLASLGFDLQHLIQAEGFDKLACLDKDNKGSAVNAVCTNDESLALFTVMARDVFKKKQSLITEPALTAPFKFQHDAIVAIYDQIHQQQELATDLNAVLRSILQKTITCPPQNHHSDRLPRDTNRSPLQ